MGGQIYQEVLVLDVSVKNPLGMALHDNVHNLGEEVPGEVLRQGALLTDKVKHVLAIEALHDHIVAAAHVKEVQKLDHARDIGHLLHEGHLQGQLAISRIGKDSLLWDFLHRHQQAVTLPDSSMDSAEASLAQDPLDLVLVLEALDVAGKPAHR